MSHFCSCVGGVCGSLLGGRKVIDLLSTEIPASHAWRLYVKTRSCLIHMQTDTSPRTAIFLTSLNTGEAVSEMPPPTRGRAARGSPWGQERPEGQLCRRLARPRDSRVACVTLPTSPAQFPHLRNACRNDYLHCCMRIEGDAVCKVPVTWEPISVSFPPAPRCTC